MAGARYRRKDNNRVGKFCIAVIIMTFAAVMSLQIARVYQKDKLYQEKEAFLKQQLAEEQERADEIKNFEIYTNSGEYVEDVAKSKLGLAYEDEIIFKETK